MPKTSQLQLILVKLPLTTSSQEMDQVSASG